VDERIDSRKKYSNQELRDLNISRRIVAQLVKIFHGKWNYIALGPALSQLNTISKFPNVVRLLTDL
jgi:hypothetical protein